jgi:phage tail sheath protein FI
MPGKYTRGAGVYRSEIDLSEVATPVGTSIGAIVDEAIQGPVNQRILITRDKQFLEVFGKPNDSTIGYGGYAALQFLKESDSLYYVRPTAGNERYAARGFGVNALGVAATVSADSTTNLLATAGYEDGNKPNDIREIETSLLGTELFNVASIGPGTYGNNIGIQIFTSASGTNFDWQNKYDTDTTSTTAIWKKVFKLSVFVKDTNASDFSGVSASPVETFYVSTQSVLDGNNNQLEMAKIINGNSKYIYVKNGGAATYPIATTGVIALTGGTDITTVTAASFISGWSLFNDREKVTVSILICTHAGDNTHANYPIQQAVGNIAASRKDCIATAQVDSVSASNVTTIKQNAGYGYTNGSYVALYSGWDKIYDQYNDKNIFIPKNIFASAIFARVDSVKNTWDAPAGPDVGVINSIGQNKVFNSTEIGTLRDANINTSKQIGGANILWSQRTAQRKESALSDINVRRCLLFVENTCENLLNSFIMQPNNEKTRLRVKSALDSFLGEVAANGGFNTDEDAGFMVVCDSTNNTPQNIANLELIVDVYVKPIRVVEFIQLNTIITRTGVNFNELIG